MLWEIDIHPAAGQVDSAALRVAAAARELGLAQNLRVAAAHGYLVEGATLDRPQIERLANELLADTIVETPIVGRVGEPQLSEPPASIPHSAFRNSQSSPHSVTVLLKPGVMDPVAASARTAAADLGISAEAIGTLRKYWFDGASKSEVQAVSNRLLANDAIEQVIVGPLPLERLEVGQPYQFQLRTVAIRELDDDALLRISRDGQLYLQPAEMQTIQRYFRELGRDPTDAELETIAQTWSEHCSHKTLAGRIAYRDERGERQFDNMLKETIFAATQQLRGQWAGDDWCVSVFQDNAGVVKFDEQFNLAFKVETHNHPSALEPYGGANTGVGGVIRDIMGTGLGAKPIANTDVFCFAPPDTPADSLPPGTLHPRRVMRGVVDGVRDYGNRMGIPTVNGAVFFDSRYLGNPLVYCGNVGLLPVDKSHKQPQPGDLIVSLGGRTGRDGIHGATFSSAELTSHSEMLSGGAVQIGNAIEEKKVLDVLLAARDRGLYSAVTDCGAGGFSSAVGEMGEKIGAAVQLEKAPLKYAGLSYTEIWISEAQERMVLAVPEAKWPELHALSESEGVEATVLGSFVPTGRLRLSYNGAQVADLDMKFLHNGRPPVVRQAVYEPQPFEPLSPVPPLQFNNPGENERPSPIARRVPQVLTYLASIDLQRRYMVDGTKQKYLLPDELVHDAQTFVEYVVAGKRGGNFSETLKQAIVQFGNVLRTNASIVSSDISNFQLVETDPQWAQIREAARSLLETLSASSPSIWEHASDYTDDLLRILAAPNVASKEWIIRQYDHEVQGSSVVKPLVGAANDGPSDAAVLRPVLSSRRGVVVACGMNPRYGQFDTYHMAASAIDEAVRNCVAVGADPRRIAILDNFCWGDCERPETLGSLVRAALACHDVSIALGTPFISGKDSLNNEFSYTDPAGNRQTIGIPASLLISALGQVDDVAQCVTMDLKQPGNLLYVVGITKDELGGSHFALVNDLEGGQVPTVDPAMAARTFAAVHRAIQAGCIRACHDLSEGGLAVAVGEMAFAGGFGAQINLDAIIGPTQPAARLFSESNTRFVCEVPPDRAADFEAALADVPLAKIGAVTADDRVIFASEDQHLIDAKITDLKAAWQSTFGNE